jgi:signal transduction histidine kinase/CheY-like chemotaxis protein
MMVDTGAAKATAWFLQHSLDAYICLQHGVIAWANDTWTALTGWPSSKTVGRLYFDFLFREDVAAAQADLDALTAGARTVFTYRVSAKTRGWRWLRHHAVRGEDGWVLMILRDITAERQRELDNEEARRVTAMVRDTAGVTAWRFDVTLDRYELNPDFTDHHDRDDGEMIAGEALRGTIYPDDLGEMLRAWRAAVATGGAGGAEYRLKSAGEPGWRHLRSAWQGVRERAPSQWDVLGVSADVTEIAEARDAALRGEKAAKAAAEAKSRFLANISHELRTPMNGVLGILHLIKAEPSRDERERLIDQALAAGAGLSDLLSDVVDFSDLEAGRLQLVAEPVDPAEQLAGVVAMFKPQAEAKGVALSLAAAPEIGWVAADAARLRKLFFHLIGNAVKFTERGAVEARLSARDAGEARRLRLEVEDTGIGIEPEAVDGLYQPFSQVDGSATRRYGGPGLGLALTRNLAELMGGGVGFSSQPGKGSTFWVEIAAPAAAAATLAEAGGEPSDWLAGVRVLVVEDNATNRLVATRMLGQLGAEVATAENGAEGVCAVERGDFDLVFMDIQMPVMDGVEATRRIRAMPRPKGQVPIVATTANVMPDQLARYRDCGVTGVVAKPISPAALLSEVARIASVEAA